MCAGVRACASICMLVCVCVCVCVCACKFVCACEYVGVRICMSWHSQILFLSEVGSMLEENARVHNLDLGLYSHPNSRGCVINIERDQGSEKVQERERNDVIKES